MTKNHKILIGVAVLALVLLTVAFAVNNNLANSAKAKGNSFSSVNADGACCPHCAQKDSADKATAVTTEKKDACCCADGCGCCDGCKGGTCDCDDCKCCGCCKK